MTAFVRASSVTVDDDDGRFCLIVETDDGGGSLQIDIHDDVLAFYAAVRRETGPYASEAESARTAVATGTPEHVYLGTADRDEQAEPWIDSGYAPDDPKSPGYHERMAD